PPPNPPPPDPPHPSGPHPPHNPPPALPPELAERALINTELAEPLLAVSIDARNLPSHITPFPQMMDEVRSRNIQCDV
ncbi:hypothetical protein RA278_30560, partial [Pseudomonas syringae pv. tagetis]